MAKQTKKVVRGAGGRFEAEVGDRLVAKQHDKIELTDLDDEPKQEAPRDGVVAQILENSSSLFNKALSLQDTLYACGVLEGNGLSLALGQEDLPDVDNSVEVETQSEQHLIQLIHRHISYRIEDKIYASAGRVLCYHALPAMALAAYVATHLVDMDRSQIFEYLERAREESNETRYHFVNELRNGAVEGCIRLDNMLLSEDMEQSQPVLREATGPLLTYLNQTNNMLIEVENALEELRRDISNSLL